jgi:hypothetical protein
MLHTQWEEFREKKYELDSSFFRLSLDIFHKRLLDTAPDEANTDTP